jgi:hypothetical protein
MIEVRKHGGHRNHKWKTVLLTVSMDKAMDKYLSTGHSIKQGFVELLVDGEAFFRHQAPRFRKRFKRQRRYLI